MTETTMSIQQTEEEALAFEVSDEALEASAGYGAAAISGSGRSD